MSKSNVPSAEHFERAKAIMRRDDRGLEEVRMRMLRQFGWQGLHQFVVLYSPSRDAFGVYVFYGRSNQIESAAASGLSDDIKEAVLVALESFGRGQRSGLNVTFEFDSDENVQDNFGGDYFWRRLR